jgi:hypothetical protein
MKRHIRSIVIAATISWPPCRCWPAVSWFRGMMAIGMATGGARPRPGLSQRTATVKSIVTLFQMALE